MFKGCSNIIEIDLSNFINSDIQNIDFMLYSCASLKNIIFRNFKAPKIKKIGKMFYGCSSLETLDLSNFDISNVIHFHYVFDRCCSLKYLDLSNFDTSLIKCNYEIIKSGCKNLEFVIFKKVKISNTLLLKYINNMIKITTKDIVFCVNILKTPFLNLLMENNKCSISFSDCSN